MNEISSISALIDMWPNVAAFARDTRVGYEAAKQMRRRNSIAVEHWPAIIDSPRGQELGLTSDDLVRLHVSRNMAPTSEDGAPDATPEDCAAAE